MKNRCSLSFALMTWIDTFETRTVAFRYSYNSISPEVIYVEDKKSPNFTKALKFWPER